MEAVQEHSFDGEPEDPSATADRECVAAILAIVQQRCGTDFGGYRPPTVLRRLLNGMRAAGAASLPEYLERLQRDPLEARRLLERLTIKVSRFFRNAGAVAVVRRELGRRRKGRPGAQLSAWSAGCGRGEEAYTLAALLAEIGGSGDPAPRVLGTDIDARALEAAAAARYPEASLAEVVAVARERWFEPWSEGKQHAVRASLRALVELRVHDLTRDQEPEGRPFDLVACRNVLIYLQPQQRAFVERLLASSVAPGGLLWLGETEWFGAGTGLLEIVDHKACLYRRREGEGSA